MRFVDSLAWRENIEGRDYLPHMYGPASDTVIDDVAKLPLKVSDIYRRITT